MFERGPSVKDISQLVNLKKIVHVRFIDFFSEDSKMMIDDDSVDTRYSPLFVESREDINQSSSSLNMSEKAKETKTLPASVPLSEMFKLGKLIKTKKELLEVNVEEFLISTKEWGTPLNIQFHVSKEVLGSGSFRDAFIAECSNCAAFPNGQYVIIKRYKKVK